MRRRVLRETGSESAGSFGVYRGKADVLLIVHIRTPCPLLGIQTLATGDHEALGTLGTAIGASSAGLVGQVR